MPKAQAAIALGSNLPSRFGGREANLYAAADRLSGLGTVLGISGFLDTEPVGFLDQPRFLNAALLLETGLEAVALMHALLAIESEMGRSRAGVPAKGPRIIDLDLIWFDRLVLNTPGLILPHPAMPERAFVLEPLAQLAPEWVHPVLGLSVAEMLQRLHHAEQATR